MVTLTDSNAFKSENRKISIKADFPTSINGVTIPFFGDTLISLNLVETFNNERPTVGECNASELKLKMKLPKGNFKYINITSQINLESSGQLCFYTENGKYNCFVFKQTVIAHPNNNFFSAEDNYYYSSDDMIAYASFNRTANLKTFTITNAITNISTTKAYKIEGKGYFVFNEGISVLGNSAYIVITDDDKFLVGGVEWGKVYQNVPYGYTLHEQTYTVSREISGRNLTSNMRSFDVYYTNTVIPYLSANNGSEWVKLGKYNITDSESTDNYKTVTLKGYDDMIKFDKTYRITATPQSDNTYTIQSLVEAMCSDLGVTLDGGVAFSNELPTIDSFPAQELSYRQMLGYLVGVMGANARINRDGNLAIQWYTLQPYEELSDILISRDLQFMNGLVLNNKEDYIISSVVGGSANQTYSKGEGTGIEFENPYVKQSDIDRIYDDITSGITSYSPMELKWRGNPTYEVGDITAVSGADDENDIKSCFIMKQEINVSGGFSHKIYCYGDTEAKTIINRNYNLQKRLNNQYTLLDNSFREVTDSMKGKKAGSAYKLDYEDETNETVATGWRIINSNNVFVCNSLGMGFSQDGGRTISNFAVDFLTGTIVANAIASGQMSSERLAVYSDLGFNDFFEVRPYHKATYTTSSELTSGNYYTQIEDNYYSFSLDTQPSGQEITLDLSDNGIYIAGEYIQKAQVSTVQPSTTSLTFTLDTVENYCAEIRSGSNSNIIIMIKNDRIAFYNYSNGEVGELLSLMSGNRFKLVTLDSLEIGNYGFKNESNGSISFSMM